MIDTLAILILIGIIAIQFFQRRKERALHADMLEACNVSLAVAEANYAHLLDRLKEKALTPRGKVAQTETERPMSGAQLTRLNNQVNAATWDGLREKPNSEILKENSNG